MAGLIRTLFKSKKSKKEEPANDIVFQSCNQRQPTARFADDCLLPATAAYHTDNFSKRRKGPQSCPGGYREEDGEGENSRPQELLRKKSSMRRKLSHHSSRQDFMIDVDREPQYENQLQKRYHRSRPDLRGHSQFDLRSEDMEVDPVEAIERKSQFYQQRWEDSERLRKEEKRRQEQLEKERNNIQHAMSNMAYCMASVQQMEQLKKERDQYRKEMSRYKSKCEKLESKCEQLETAAMSPGFGGFQAAPHLHFQPSPYHTPQYPAPMSFAFPNPAPPTFQPLQPLATNFMNTAPTTSRNSGSSTRNPSSFALSNTSTTISEGAGESLANPADFTFMRNSFKPPPSQILSGNVGPSAAKARSNFNFFEEDEDEVKNFRVEQPLPTPSPYSELTSSDSDNVV